jgi:hypothetical protein
MNQMNVYARRVKHCLFRGLISTVVLGSVVGANAQSVTIGSGAGGNVFPFGLYTSGFGPGTDYEQVYNSASFSSSLDINQISFFVLNPGDWDAGTYSLYLSTTSVGVGGLTGTPSDIGANNQLFGTFALSGAVPSGQFTFSGTSFDYNPTQGNLLLDIVISGQSYNGGISLQAMDGDAGTLFSRYYNAGAGTSGYGLVTEFSDVPASSVPDSSSVLVLLSGACLALETARRKLA